MARPHPSIPLLALLLAALAASPALAQTADAGTPVVSVHTTDEVSPILVRDGADGAFVGFQTIRTTNTFCGGGYWGGIIHVARLRPDATPAPEWTHSQADPIWVAYGERTMIVPALLPGPNGASPRVWAVGTGEAMTASASCPAYYTLQVDPGGVTVIQAGRGIRFISQDMQAVPQPGGGALILYSLNSSADFSEPGVLVDRVDAIGVLSHRAIPLSVYYTSSWIPVENALAGADGSAIAVVSVSAGVGTRDLYAVSLLADGSPAWSPAERPISAAAGRQQNSSCASDGAGGLFVAWSDERTTATMPDVYATHMLADGTIAPGWAANGKAISATTGEQSHASTVADGAGGAWLVWTDARSGNYEIYYTHLHADGTPAAGFGVSGRQLSNAAGAKRDALAVSDGAGGLFAVWRDGRNLAQWDLYGQHILADGSVAPGLAAAGEPICTNPADQTDLALLDTAENAAIVAWRDNRTGVGVLYAAQVPAGNSSLGAPGHAGSSLALAPAGPNPVHGVCEWSIDAPDAGPVTVRLIDAQGRVRTSRTVDAPVTGARVRFDMPEPGLFFVTVTQAGRTVSSRVASIH